MSTVTTWQTVSTSSAATEKLAEKLGKRLKGHEVIELISDLGGGKTTFVRGLARGLGSTDKVASPSFTLSKVYKSGELELHHFDFYRLEDAGIMKHEVMELLDDPNCIVVVEWADAVKKVLPTERLVIHIKAIDNNSRELLVEYPEALAYLVEEL